MACSQSNWKTQFVVFRKLVEYIQSRGPMVMSTSILASQRQRIVTCDNTPLGRTCTTCCLGQQCTLEQFYFSPRGYPPYRLWSIFYQFSSPDRKYNLKITMSNTIPVDHVKVKR